MPFDAVPHSSGRPPHDDRSNVTAETPTQAAPRRHSQTEAERRQRGLVADLLASFALAHRPDNAVALLATAGGVIAVQLAIWVLGQLPLIGLLGILLVVLALVYVLQFLWGTLCRTARGEDDLPLTQPDWDIWGDAVEPALTLILVTALCAASAVAVHYAAPDEGWRPWATWALAALGLLLWPAAVLSVAISDSLLALRPDYLLRTIATIGAPYLLALAVIVGAIVAAWWLHAASKASTVPGLAVLGVLLFWPVMLYAGYVVFRTIGVMYWHHRGRFPWEQE